MEIDDTTLHSLCAQGASRPPSSGVTSDDTNRRVLLVRFLLYISCSPPPPYSPGAQNFIYEPTGPFSTLAHHLVRLASLQFPSALPEEARQTHQARRPTARAILEAPDMQTVVKAGRTPHYQRCRYAHKPVTAKSQLRTFRQSVRSGLSIPCNLHTFISRGSSPRPTTVSGRSRTPGTDRFIVGTNIWWVLVCLGRTRFHSFGKTTAVYEAFLEHYLPRGALMRT